MSLICKIIKSYVAILDILIDCNVELSSVSPNIEFYPNEHLFIAAENQHMQKTNIR